MNELFEQAKFIGDWYGRDWSSALCQDKEGKTSHEIICESRGEVVISTGSNSNEASWLCDYLELCSPENIAAIAQSFVALEKQMYFYRNKFLEMEQRAELAEGNLILANAQAEKLEREMYLAVDNTEKVQQHLIEVVRIARSEWMESNDPKDGTDCVTPYDHYLYNSN